MCGDITGYEFVHTPHVSVRLIEGKDVETNHKGVVPASARAGVGNKSIEVQKDGTLTIDATVREPR